LNKGSFVRILIRDARGRVLVVSHRSGGTRVWNLPGGKVERSEAPETAARREVMEETGLMLRSLTLVYTDHFQVNAAEWQGYFYEGEPLETEPYNMEPNKLGRVSFVDMPQLQKYGSKPFLVDVLRHWVKDIADGEPWQAPMNLRLP
jgi:8-oxo-dGTP pyrophosphatase MutT (NUDIX family)